MVLTFWGVRASTPVPGPSTVRVGGNTVCIDIAEGSDGQHVVMDAGTGIIMLGKRLLAGPCGKGRGEVHIFLTRTHWDHIQGFPFFIPAFIPGNHIILRGRAVSSRTVRELLEAQMRGAYSPIFALGNMGATIDVEEMDNSAVTFGPFTMATIVLPHRGLSSLGYRISAGGRSAVLLGDLHYEGTSRDTATAFAAGADLIVHDVGDSAMNGSEARIAIAMAREAGAPRLLFTHYAPRQADDDVEHLVAAARREAGPSLAVDAAREGMQVVV